MTWEVVMEGDAGRLYAGLTGGHCDMWELARGGGERSVGEMPGKAGRWGAPAGVGGAEGVRT